MLELCSVFVCGSSVLWGECFEGCGSSFSASSGRGLSTGLDPEDNEVSRSGSRRRVVSSGRGAGQDPAEPRSAGMGKGASLGLGRHAERLTGGAFREGVVRTCWKGS